MPENSTRFGRAAGRALLAAVLLASCGGSSSRNTNDGGSTATIDLNASATLTSGQATQNEVIFAYSFPLPAGQQQFVGLQGSVSLISSLAAFNESLNTVAYNASGTCPADGSTFPDYTSLYGAFPNLQPLQGFILKSPDAGTSTVPISYTMPAGIPIANCMVVLLDWEGSNAVTMQSALQMTYNTSPSLPAGQLLSTAQEFVFGIDQGPGSTSNDALSFVQETTVPQAGTLEAFVGDISDSTFYIPPPPGVWQGLNDIYLVPGGCPSDIPVNSGGWTPNGGYYYLDIPANAQHLFSDPLNGYQAAAAQTFVYQPINVTVNSGDCLLTLFGVNAPAGGGIDSENQVQTLFVPQQ
jgi:hypothetical protein